MTQIFVEMNKPQLQEGELLCEGCWKVRDKGGSIKESWMFFNFKYLKPVWLCSDCQKKYASDFVKKQLAGL